MPSIRRLLGAGGSVRHRPRERGPRIVDLRRSRPLLVVAALCCLPPIAGCGGDDATEELALQRQIEAERRDAAEEARRDERLRRLERALRAERRRNRRTVTERVVTAPPPSGAASAATAPGGSIAQLGSFVTRSSAEAHAATLAARGLSVSILHSSDYREMRPGFGVVYAGPYDASASADAAAADARAAGARDAFARHISPR
jgi:cell division protein FtsN